MQISTRVVLAAAGLFAVSLIPAASAYAGPVTDHQVRELATRGGALVAQEQQLVATADRDSIDRLGVVDAQAVDLLGRLDELGVMVDPAVRLAMTALPTSETSIAPPAAVYGAAVAGLDRMAAAPGAFVPGGTTDNGSSASLLIVAAGALVALGFAASSRMRDADLEADLEADADLDASDVIEGTPSGYDGLTGVASRQRLERDLAAARHADHLSVAVIMLGVDGFDTVATSHGYQWGGDLLRHLGTTLVAYLRDDHDTVYRYGGEQFCIVLGGAGTTDALMLSERLVSVAQAIRLPDDSPLIVSVGVASGEAADLPAMVGAADRALDEARISARVRAAAALQVA